MNSPAPWFAKPSRKIESSINKSGWIPKAIPIPAPYYAETRSNMQFWIVMLIESKI